MNRDELATALVLSVPLGVGVGLAVLKTTRGQGVALAVGAGGAVALALFGLLVVAVAEPDGGDGADGDGSDSPDGGDGDSPTEENREPSFRDRLAALRSDGGTRETAPGDLLAGAGLGALLTVFLWYIPLSPLLGGAAAGFLQSGDRRDGLLAGAIAGALVPLVVAIAAGAAFLLAGVAVLGRFPFGPEGAVVIAVAGVGYTVGLGAVGGYLGAAAGERGDEHRRAIEHDGGAYE